MSTDTLRALPVRRERHFGDRVVWCFSDRPPTVHEMFARGAARDPDAIALVFGETTFTYAALCRQVERGSAGLHGLGIGPGMRVALLLANGPAFVVLFLAIQRLGAVAVPMDVRLTAAEIEHGVGLTGASLLVHDPGLSDRVAGCNVATIAIASGGMPFEGHAPTDAPAPARPDEDDPALILFTSGTTGKPKGAILTHLNIVHSTLNHAGNLGLVASDRSLVAVPLSHVTGVICAIMAPFWTGGTLILLPRFKAREFLAAAARWRMSYTIMVPAMYALCLLEPDFDAYDLSSWRLGHYGASPMPERTLRRLRESLPDLVMVNGYGATETCSPALMTPVGGGSRDLPVGAPALPCVEVAVVDPETGIEVPAGETGELWIRGPNVSPGYWGDADATARAFIAGYWRSGDIGSADAAGNIAILDRLKDVINRGGYKIYSAEVEAVLARHPGIEEAAVVGIPDDVLGERVHAFVRAMAPLTAEEIAAYCAAHLGDYKVPESWRIGAEALPRNSMGKIDKKTLRASAASGQEKERAVG